ncbi:hypothetical protein LLG95_06370 [bacterium]|nr:hypothetical protein [bacterium]
MCLRLNPFANQAVNAVIAEFSREWGVVGDRLSPFLQEALIRSPSPGKGRQNQFVWPKMARRIEKVWFWLCQVRGLPAIRPRFCGFDKAARAVAALAGTPSQRAGV